jgi:hypothetical protein
MQISAIHKVQNEAKFVWCVKCIGHTNYEGAVNLKMQHIIPNLALIQIENKDRCNSMKWFKPPLKFSKKLQTRFGKALCWLLSQQKLQIPLFFVKTHTKTFLAEWDPRFHQKLPAVCVPNKSMTDAWMLKNIHFEISVGQKQ